jgi:hypothetical protein
VPFFGSRFILPVLFVFTLVCLYVLRPGEMISFFNVDEFSAARVPALFFFSAALVLTVLCAIYNFSLIPVLGILGNLYLMSELALSNWTWFGIWLALGLLVYFGYGRFKSKLRAA